MYPMDTKDLVEFIGKKVLPIHIRILTDGIDAFYELDRNSVSWEEEDGVPILAISVVHRC